VGLLEKMTLLTQHEVMSVHRQLGSISDTWADLWSFLHYLPVGPSRLVGLRYTDIAGDRLILPGRGRFQSISLPITPFLDEVLQRRRRDYPGDIFIFQSHSNRVKAAGRPVTVIAFNAALKVAAIGITEKKISSKSARLR
jgi:hypothetical protein